MFLLITQNQFYRKAPYLVMLGHIFSTYEPIGIHISKSHFASLTIVCGIFFSWDKRIFTIWHMTLTFRLQNVDSYLSFQPIIIHDFLCAPLVQFGHGFLLKKEHFT